jgi:hypothetical protein
MSSDGTKMVAVVDGGFIYTSAESTTPGTQGGLTGEQGSAIELVYVGNNQFMQVSQTGTMTRQ